MKTWVLVANRTGARLFEQRAGRLERIEQWAHPEGRLRDRDIQADKPGRSFDKRGMGQHDYSPEESPLERRAANFARELAAALDHGRARDVVERIVLVAEPSFLGLIRGSLSAPTAALVEDTVGKDLVHVEDRDVGTHLGGILPLSVA